MDHPLLSGEMRVLCAAEIEELSRQSNFAQAAESFAITTAFKPIDNALRAAKEQWLLAQPWGFPEFHYRGQLIHPPVAPSVRRHYPEALWEGASETVFFRIQGVEVNGLPILAFTPGEPSINAPTMLSLSLWGWANGALIHERSLPLQLAQAIAQPDALKAAFARLEARQIEADSAPATESHSAKRV